MIAGFSLSRHGMVGAFALLWLSCGAWLYTLDDVPPSGAAMAYAGSGSSTAVGMPVRLRIDALGIDAPIVPVGVNEKGEMDVPGSADSAGWYQKGPLPGQNGSAVIAGHVDTWIGTPALFSRLHELSVGDVIEVTDTAGRVTLFAVKRSRTYPLEQAPEEIVFSDANIPQLNLVTCAGHKTWSGYTDRLVVYARGMDGTMIP
jgi:LPXTG-site transpeptidase (sortase) family protein